MRKVLWSCFLALAGIVALAVQPGAQGGITVTAPAANARLAAGPDYATDVLGDPWDMANAADISPDPQELTGWSNFGFTQQGEVGGTLTKVPASLSLLAAGRYGSINPGRNGLRYPIDSATYTRLSFKMKSAAGQDPRVYWYHNPWEHPSGLAFGVQFASTTTGGYQIFTLDLAKPPASGVAWTSGVVRDLRFDPNSYASNFQVLFDWVRVTVADTHPAAVKQTITWSGGTGSTTISVVDAGGTTTTVATGLPGSSYTWYYGGLPPGAYTLRVTRNGVTGTQPFTINAPPIAHLTDPDETGGEDFATAVLGNPWDMSDSADLRTLPGDHLVQRVFSGGVFQGVSDGVPVAYAGTTPVGDPIVFPLAGNGTIDTTRYRYLSVRMRVDDPYDLGLGSVGRVFWGSASAPYDLTISREWMAWPGWNTFTVDLGSLNTSPTGGIVTTAGRKQLWAAAPVRNLRIDPHEFAQVRGFQIDYIKLAAIDEAKGSFLIRWTGADPDGDASTITLYRDTNRNPADGKTLIGSANITAGQKLWNTAGVPGGDYYIYAEVSDGSNVTGSYSTGAVRVLTGAAASSPAMAIDTPAAGAVPQHFTISGWAIDQSATGSTGVDAVHIYATPNPGSGAAAQFLGAASYGQSRTDVATAFGAAFGPSGYSLDISSLTPGVYRLTAYAHSTIAGAFTANRSVDVTVTSSLVATIDSPANSSTVVQPFVLTGTSLDTAAPTGIGVDAVHVYAYPSAGGASVWAGVATLGGNRPAAASAYGAQFANSGFSISVTGLAPGSYRFVAYSHSTVTGAFTQTATSVATLVLRANPGIVVDAPVAGATVDQVFTIRGWALDRAAAAGSGVDTVTVSAFRRPGTGPAIPLGNAVYGQSRTDVGAAFGSAFTPSGYALVGTLAAGTYDVAVVAHSTVSGSSIAAPLVRVTVRQVAPVVFVDQPTASASLSTPFSISGWTIDRFATADSGVDAVHVWAYPVGGGPAVWVGAATSGISRPDVANAYGSQFAASGFALASVTLPSGTWDLAMFPHATGTQSFWAPTVRRITVF